MIRSGWSDGLKKIRNDHGYHAANQGAQYWGIHLTCAAHD
jgi:hypothetical protein